jgi:hypothetical protein
VAADKALLSDPGDTAARAATTSRGKRAASAAIALLGDAAVAVRGAVGGGGVPARSRLRALPV